MLGLVFDTETSGLPSKGSPLDPACWPFIVQFSFVFFDTETSKYEAHDYIIKGPFELCEEVVKIHGITKKRSDNCGLYFKDVVQIFLLYLKRAEFLIAHNLDFDLNMLRVECKRNDVPFDDSMLPMQYCTMKKNKTRCGLVAKNGFPKNPKLSELYLHLFGECPESFHNSMVDTYACMRCFYKSVLKKDAPLSVVRNIY
jgi:DNA polymerase III epsilon subunit-like protein